MKKVYYSFVLVLMTLMSMNVLADTPIKLDVDDASRIRVKVNYSPIENIKNGAYGSNCRLFFCIRCSIAQIAG